MVCPLKDKILSRFVPEMSHSFHAKYEQGQVWHVAENIETIFDFEYFYWQQWKCRFIIKNICAFERRFKYAIWHCFESRIKYQSDFNWII